MTTPVAGFNAQAPEPQPIVPRRRASDTSRLLMRWHGLGAMLAVAFYSLFFSAHLKFKDTPIYIRDGIIFSARTQTVFLDLAGDRSTDHRGITAVHPAFTLLHQPLTQVFIKGWQLLGQPEATAARHGVAMLTCLAASLSVVMVYHTLLWSGANTLRSLLMAMTFGASTCAWIMAPLPETWIFAGLGAALMASVTARGALARPAWHLTAYVYAVSCFVGNIIPCLIMALTRCAQERAQTGGFNIRPLLLVPVAITLSFGLANLQREIYPRSSPLPTNWKEVQALRSEWKATTDTAPLIAREIFVSNIVTPAQVTAVPDKTRSKVILNRNDWSTLGLHQGLTGGWLLVIALASAGILWRARKEPLALGLIATLIWSISIVSWYGTQDRLLVHACLWTPIVVMIVGLGLERALRQWRFISKPVTLFLAIFVSTLITRNWMFLSEVAGIPGR